MRTKIFDTLTILSILLTIINAALFVGHIRNNKAHITRLSQQNVVATTNATTHPRLVVLSENEYIDVPIDLSATNASQTYLLKNGTTVKINR